MKLKSYLSLGFLPLVLACDYTSLRKQIKEGRELADGPLTWDYSGGADGPANWPKKFEACGGQEQSPVDIPGHAAFDNDLFGVVPSFKFAYTPSSVPETIKFENLGKTVEAVYSGLDFKLANAEALAFIVGRSDTFEENEYTLEQFHFHWGLSDEEGSEHTFNGSHYPLEMHLVHYNSAKYTSVSEAAGHADGLLVVAVFFDVNRGNAVVPNYLEAFLPYLNNPDFITGEEHEVEDFVLHDLVTDLDTGRFYLYPGSLTTPTCNEVVTWVIMKDVLLLDEETIDAFRGVIGYKNTTIAPNFRPAQNGNERIIFDAEFQKFAILGEEVVEPPGDDDDNPTDDDDDGDGNSASSLSLSMFTVAVSFGVIVSNLG